jgi:hypothetical protein
MQTQNDTYQIFCDMDGVLTDFNGDFIKLPDNKDGIGPAEYEDQYGKEAFWSLIDKYGEDFWSNMSWMPDGKQLWNFLVPYDPVILSAPSKNKVCVTGKLKWIDKNLPQIAPNPFQLKSKNGWDGVSQVILDPDKYRYARSKYDILIDDTPKKINPWRDTGAIGILHISADETISILKTILNKE